MPSYSLVPVDYQPDFSNFSLVPVDYDPFRADGPIQQAGTQPEGQPKPDAGSDQPPSASQTPASAPPLWPIGPNGGQAPSVPQSPGQDLHSQYQALRPMLGDRNAMLATVYPEVRQTLIAQALAGQQLASQPQPLTNGAGQPNVGALANNVPAATSGESYDPDSESASGIPGSGQPTNPAAAPVSSPNKPPLDWSGYNQPFGELKPATYRPTQQIGNTVANALMGLGMQPYTAKRSDLTRW